MNSSNPVRWPVLYIRGLNTSGDDALHLGPLALGPMSRPWVRTLTRHGIETVAVENLGGGPVAEQVHRAIEFLRRHPAWRDTNSRFHILAHSTGGLTARALIHELGMPERFVSLVTLSTPHQGTSAALWIQDVPAQRPLLNRLFKKVNYDIHERSRSFRSLTPQALDDFNRRYPDYSNVVYASATFRVSPGGLSWPLLLANRILTPGKTSIESDGIVDFHSQAWGQVIHSGNLDHLNQIGYDLSPNPLRRRQVKREFNQLVASLMEFWRDVEAKSTR